MIEALLDGQTDPTILADLARGRLRDKRAELEQALEGRLQGQHRFMLLEYLEHIDYLGEAIAHFSTATTEQVACSATG